MSIPVTVFYSYAENTQDQILFAQLEKHLKILEHTGLIAGWHKQEIRAGQDQQDESNRRFEQAKIILLLISPEFIASSPHYYGEMARALEKQRRGEAYVVPVLLRPVYYQNAPFAHLAMLPADGRAITSWGEKSDEAFVEITSALVKILQDFSPSASLDAPKFSEAPQERATASSLPAYILQKEPSMNEETIVRVVDALTFGVEAQSNSTLPIVRGWYERLNQLLLNRCVERRDKEVLLDFTKEPSEWRGPLKKMLIALRVDLNGEIVMAAEKLLEAKPQSSGVKFAINNSGYIGQQNIGDYHRNSNQSGERPPREKQ